MEYNFNDIEKKWQSAWKESGIYNVSNDSMKPKYYVLDMFPYPSGAGLHVGHPLGYIASDIYARYKRLKGFNVLHPMGYDAFGLPAEQYAIDRGIHPAISTENNIQTFRKQLDNIGFCYDWSREVRTSDPGYYKWTQWIFLQLFDSWFDRAQQKAERIPELIKIFTLEGNKNHPVPNEKTELTYKNFTAAEWNGFDEATRQHILMEYRLAYCGYGEVNWCEALGTVLANDEVVNGVSERGGHPVVKKKLRQWYLRITEYADRLLEGLTRVDFSEAMKEMQTNWIGKSSGAEIVFKLKAPLNSNEDLGGASLRVYTTRPDTIFGVDFMVVAPELDIVHRLKTAEQSKAVDDYIDYVKSRSERERQSEKKITGVFTGAYALNPFSGKEIPIWISEYVLAGYGTGAIMAVPCGDERDFKFAQHFQISITNIIGSHFNGQEANPTKDAILENSDFLNGMVMKDAIDVVINEVEKRGIGVRKTNYKMRDAAFSRQRYWGEPFPIIWKDGIAYPLSEEELPLQLPEVETYRPGPEGEGPLANIQEWVNKGYETNTMPGYAGSSWYFLRYMDPHNDKTFCSRQASDYWNQVDLYIGGTEHAVGHLLYSRLWTKIIHDLGYIGFDEPYKKLVNQGMIQGRSSLAYRFTFSAVHYEDGRIMTSDDFPFKSLLISKNIAESLINKNGELDTIYFENFFDQFYVRHQVFLIEDISLHKIHIPVEFVDYNGELNISAYERKNHLINSYFIKENPGIFLCEFEVEKMSKSKFNTVNPDDLVEKYGADTFRMYEMFLGPVEQSKPWDTKGIEGVHRFLKKLWRLFYDDIKGQVWNEEAPHEAELKALHKAIKKIEEDTERFSFNTGVSGFMILVNELTDLRCHKKAVLEALLIMLAPYAPHIAEELWHLMGSTTSVLDAAYPIFEEKYIRESEKEYPISVNGKLRTTLKISLTASQEEVEKLALSNEVIQKWVEGKTPKKIIYVKNKMVNIVV